MLLRFFADHCVANSVVAALVNAGHDVLKLRDRMPVNSPDPAVVAMAQSLDSSLLSLNGDFTDIVSYPPASYKGIVALRIRNHPELTSQVTARLLAYLRLHPEPSCYVGKLFIVEPHQIRIRSG